MCAQEASGKFLKALYVRLREPAPGEPDLAEPDRVELPDVRLPFRGKVVLCPPGSAPPRRPKALVCECDSQFVGRDPAPYPCLAPLSLLPSPCLHLATGPCRQCVP